MTETFLIDILATDAHNMLNGNRRRATHFFLHILFGRPLAPSAADCCIAVSAVSSLPEHSR